uniref:Uncharacterized protein n=1 Tax=Glossina pallidipes TaxID=7398 RepID=A0A3F2Z494_GLOPL
MQSWFLVLIGAQTITIILGLNTMLERYNAKLNAASQEVERQCLREENIPGKFSLPNYNLTEHFVGQIEHAKSVPRNAKCYLRCLYKKIGILKANLAVSMGPTPEYNRLLRECTQVAKEWAQKQSNGDECEFTYSFYNCLQESMVKCLTWQNECMSHPSVMDVKSCYF